ncbi:oligosaccharide flippase family protein [Paracoccaceae bacterium]|nr:oligosaccharide flippase family protein [Paracoccaceae bacterium]MDC0867646.1 oligosaccharide flippase family protein [Paracoccaceae bacterium]
MTTNFMRLFRQLFQIKLLSLILGLLNFTLMVNTIPAEEFGLYTLYIAYIPTASTLMAGGLSSLITRELVVAIEHGGGALAHINRYLKKYNNIALIIIAMATILFLTHYLNGYIYIVFLSAYVLGQISVDIGILKGLGKPSLSEIQKQVVLPCLMLSGTIFIASFFTEYLRANIFLSLYLTAHVTILIILKILVRSFSDKIAALEKISTTKIDLTTQIRFIAVTLISSITPNLIIIFSGFFENAINLTYLRVSERFGQLLIIPSMVINLFLVAEFAKYNRRDRAKELSHLYTLSVLFAGGVAMILFIIFFVFGDLILTFLFDEATSENSVSNLLMISFTYMLSALIGPAGVCAMALGKENLVLVIDCLFVLLSVAFGFIIYKLLGKNYIVAIFMFGLTAKNIILLVALWLDNGVRITIWDTTKKFTR